MFQRFSISVFQCFSISVLQYFSVSLFQYFSVVSEAIMMMGGKTTSFAFTVHTDANTNIVFCVNVCENIKCLRVLYLGQAPASRVF